MDAMRERTLVGLFVLIAGGLLFGTMLAVSGGIGTSSVSHRAFFKFAGGVQPGAPVRYGGLTVGKSSIDNGHADFTGVKDIHDVLGSYAAGSAHAATVDSGAVSVMTKGEISMALSGTGRGWDVGVDFDDFTITQSTKQ